MVLRPATVRLNCYRMTYERINLAMNFIQQYYNRYSSTTVRRIAINNNLLMSLFLESILKFENIIVFFMFEIKIFSKQYFAEH